MISPRRRRFASLAGGLVLSLVLVSGCAGQRAPDSYTDSVRVNFIKGCTQVSEQDGTLGSAADVNDYCTCVWGQIKENVKFSEFKSVTDDLTESGGSKLPESFQKAYDSCDKPTG